MANFSSLYDEMLYLFMETAKMGEHPNEGDLLPPLSIERTMEGPWNSAAPLLQLAPELLSIILFHVDSAGLANLALVNSDCRQLARSSQFTNIHLDYSPASLSLVACLQREKQVHKYLSSLSDLQDGDRNMLFNNNGVWGGPIGICIRRITVATKPQWLTQYYTDGDGQSTEDISNLDVSVQSERLAGALVDYYEYVQNIESLICPATLPHLHAIDWWDRASAEQSFFNALTTSSIQHLHNFKVSVKQEFEVVTPPLATRWNLRSLSLNMGWAGESEEGSVALISTSLLRSCAHSLESLAWKSSGTTSYSFGSDPARIPRFEKLRHFTLPYIKFQDIQTANALLAASLSVLDLRFSRDKFMQEALGTRGQIRTLDTLLFRPSKTMLPAWLLFLKANAQISSLTFVGPWHDEGMTLGNEDALDDDFLETTLLPSLSASLHSLRSLRLTWNWSVTTIPVSALRIIGSMKTLEQVCISAGSQFGERFDWVIDHESMRSHLSNLPKLKYIAFTRDTYELETCMGPPTPGRYYEDLFPEEEQLADSALNSGNLDTWKAHWEEMHKQRMLIQAAKYVELMPRLEQMYFGQLVMEVVGHERGGARGVSLLDGGRGDSWDVLNRMFGWEGIRLW